MASLKAQRKQYSSSKEKPGYQYVKIMKSEKRINGMAKMA
jgi:hypothetical protein